jgi:hypothetical protein
MTDAEAVLGKTFRILATEKTGFWESMLWIEHPLMN